MAEYGEWNRKGASLSDVTARKEYGVDRAFIICGIEEGELEYREGAMHGNPYIRVLRRELEGYIVKKRGEAHLARVKKGTEMKEIEKEIRATRKKLKELEMRKAEIGSLMDDDG